MQRFWQNKYLPAAFFLLVTLAYFYKMFFGQMPIPTDILTGAYFPWLDYKWGFAVGVPVKNPSLSDVFATLYPWRELAVDMLKGGQWPLWNPYSFAGTPLLANWQSAPFYPLNILMLLLGNGLGWSLIIVLQLFLGMSFMYLYLRELSLNKLPAVTGAAVFSLSGFMTTYLEYATAGQVFIWLPLLLWLIERYFNSKRFLYLLLISPVLFPILTAGSFQAAFYALMLTSLYFVLKNYWVCYRRKLGRQFIRETALFAMVFVLGLGTAALQLLPTLEFLNLSIRQFDHNIIEYHYGLLPVQNLITFISPDFFGNPSTGNFWGFMGYQETSGYFGVLAGILVLVATLSIFKNRLFVPVFFGVVLLATMAMVIDSPLSRLVYELKVPVFSTSYATRLLLLTTMAAAVLSAFGLEYSLRNLSVARKAAAYLFAATLGVILGLFICVTLLSNQAAFLAPKELVQFKVAFKNTLVPLLLIAVFIALMVVVSRLKKAAILLVLLVVLDLMRFSLKFNGFSPQELLYPVTPVISFLQQNSGFYRIDREQSEVMPPNSWMPYRLSAPSGYDPLYSKQYAQFFDVYNGGSPDNDFSRYAELKNYNSPFIDLAGVKFLVAAKRDKDGVIDEDSKMISYKISDPKYTQVFEDKTTLVLNNTQVMPRASLFDKFEVEGDHRTALEKVYKGLDFRNKIILSEHPGPVVFKKDPGDQAEITVMEPNRVVVNVSSKNNVLLMLTDSYYPGWQASVDNRPAKLMTADGIFRAVAVPGGTHQVVFDYSPDSFDLGLKISVFSFLVIIGLLAWPKARKVVI